MSNQKHNSHSKKSNKNSNRIEDLKKRYGIVDGPKEKKKDQKKNKKS